jgi:hypothetical protein
MAVLRQRSKRCAFRKTRWCKASLPSRDSLGVWARENTCWEAIAIAAGVDLLHLLGAALVAQREHTGTAAKVVAMSRHLEIVKKRIEYAKLPVDGEIVMPSIS